jgi:ADP-ribosylglycohydrolase
MLGAIVGDVIGSTREHAPLKTTAFTLFDPTSRFTDDSVLTVATAQAILRGAPYEEAYADFGKRYPDAGYGVGFRGWLFSDGAPVQSWGNGAAMRVSPVGWAFNNIEDVLVEAGRTAAITHGHPEGIKGAQAVALAVFMARAGASKEEIRRRVAARFAYDLHRTISDIRPVYTLDLSCQGSVPEAIIAFLDSTSFEDAVRLAVSLGGDADTQASIAGAIAHAYYGELPTWMVNETRARLPVEFVDIIDAFQAIVSSTVKRTVR